MFDSTTRNEPQDYLLPIFPRNYIDFMDEISAESLYEGLLGHGLFADKLPPMFTSEAFMRFCAKQEDDFKESRADWVSFSYIRNIGIKRDFGIPSPFSYEKLVRHISAHWDEIRTALRSNTQGHPYRISRIHLRKRKSSKSLFNMNYHCWPIEEDPLPALMIGYRFVVNCDISRCFPSIYTHALDWAILGKEQAKKNSRGKICPWSHDLDKYAMNVTNGETHGLLVGPHASNLLAELILTQIDKKLFEKGYRFLRHIDDYCCYVDSEARGRSFVLDLEAELHAFGLSTNQKKTRVRKLPLATTEDWVTVLKNSIPSADILCKRDIERFVDTAISVMGKSDNSSALSYAFGVLAKRPMNHRARDYYGDIALHLACTLPYLLPFLEERVIEPAKIPNERIKIFANLLYRKSIEERDYLSASYCIYYAMRYSFDIEDLSSENGIASLLEADDCILHTCTLEYARRCGDSALLGKLIELALTLAGNESDFQKNWLFIYEALPIDQIPSYLNGAWRAIKRKRISFIDQANLDEPPNNEEPIEEVLETLNEKLEFDEGEASEEFIMEDANEL